MNNLIRTDSPVFMINFYKYWGKQFDGLKRTNTSLGRRTQFNWYTHNGQRVNQILLPLLQNMTQFHCSFCDIKEVEEGVNEPTIEHFRPSSRYPLLSHFWHNLFLCCYSCQKSKMDEFDKNLLKPDKLDYSFDDYFIIDWASGDLIEKHQAPDVRYEKARVTIKLYGLNKIARSKARLRELKHYSNDVNPVLDEYSYRFFIIRS